MVSKNIDIENIKININYLELQNKEENDITIDISAKLPSSPDPGFVTLKEPKHGKITKHPPKHILLRPPTVRGNDGGSLNNNKLYHGVQINDAGSTTHKSQRASLVISDKNESEEGQKINIKINDHPKPQN